MKKNWSAGIALAMMAMLSSCSEETTLNTPTRVTFKDSQNFTENSTNNELVIEFNKPANHDGKIWVTIESEFLDAFETTPAIEDGQLEIPVAKGSSGASFIVNPVNNTLLDGNKTITFTLKEVSEGFTIGNASEIPISILDDESHATVDFASLTNSVNEHDLNGLTLQLNLSAPAPGTGTIKLKLQQAYDNTLFTTEPPLAADGSITFEIEPGDTQIAFKLHPVNNSIIKGHQSLNLVINQATGVLIKGLQSSTAVTILDDELSNKPLSYESAGGGWKSKKQYVYDELGRISKIHWETETPYLLSGTDTYYYSQDGLIERVNHYPNQDEYYYAEEGKIVRSEVIKNGIRTEYTEYGYDPAGNVGGKTSFHRQTDGSFLQGFTFIYLYFTNGNIYKQLTYQPVEGEEEPILISTRTYDHYLTALNPFPVYDIIPNISAQKNLPGSYRLEGNGTDLLYNFTYDFSEEGFLTKRTTGGETTVYKYY